MTHIIQIVLIEFFLLLVLAFLSAAEAAILGANRLRAKHQAEIGTRGAKALVLLHSDKENFLPSILAAETLLTVGISTLGTALIATIRPGPGGLLASTLIITPVILFLGEIVPKSIATRTPDRLSYFTAPTILFITRIFSKFLHPFTWVLQKALGFLKHDSTHPIPTEKELKYLISVSREHGILQKEEEALLQNIFDFTDAKVGEVMIPRTKVESLEADASIQEVLDKFTETGFSRFPVHAKDLDHVLGLIDVRDILTAFSKGEKKLDLKTFIRPANFVPESKRVGSLLHEMQKEHFHMAIVVDEYGGTAGLVSLTNLLEEIVGKLEHNSLREEIHPLNETTLIVSSSTKLEELEERFGTHFSTEDYQTIGGLVFGLFGRVPEQGEQILYQNLKFTITEKDGYKINKIMIETIK